MPDKFAKYTIDRSLLRRLVPIAQDQTVIVANRYIAPDPFAVIVDHMIAGDMYTDPKVITPDGRTYPLSVCFAE